MKRVAVMLGILAALAMLQTPLKAGQVFTDRKTGKTVIELKVDGLPNPTGTDVNTRANVEIVKDFVTNFPELFKRKYAEKYKKNPEKYGKFNWDNVEIRLKPFSGIKVEGVENDLLAIAGNMAPDVLYINFRKSDNYSSNSFLYPLDEFIDNLSDAERKQFLGERIHPKILPVIHRIGPDGKKHYWAVTYGGSPLGKVMMYRKDLFDKHNIPYPTANWTWENLLDACKKISDPGNGIYGIMLGRGKSESWHWLTFLWCAGGEVMEQDKDTGKWRCSFGSEAGLRALDFYTRLSAEKWVDAKGVVRRGYAYKDARAGNKWANGEIGVYLTYIDERTMSTFNPEIYGMAPVPMGYPDEKGVRHRGGELNCTMFGMFGGITNPVIRDAAWEYMYHRDSDAGLRVRTRVLVEGGMGQFVMPRYLERFGYKDLLRLAPKSFLELYEVCLASGKPEPYGKNSNFAYERMSIPLQIAEAMELSDQLSSDPTLRTEQLRKVIRKAEADANEIMIGDITDAERTKRRVIACCVLLGILIAYYFVFRKIFRIFTPPKSILGVKQETWGFRRFFWAYVLLIPAVLTILVWQYLPLARGSVMAFQDYKIIGKSIFVGVDNFGNLIMDGAWWSSIWNAFRYSLLVISLTFLPPMILAVLLQEVPKGKLLFRMIYYLPAVISGLVTMLLWKQFYEPSEFGALNQIVLRIPAIGFIGIGAILMIVCFMFARRLAFYRLWGVMTIFIIVGFILFGAVSALSFPVIFPGHESLSTTCSKLLTRLFQTNSEPYRWLFNPNTAMVSCVIPMVWAGMGPGCLIYLAALKGIPEDYYEAADLDGATFIDKILFVVFPTLKALIVINFVGAFIHSWYSSTGSILVMTGGDAATRTETAGLFIWYKAFTYLNFGPATAAAWMLAFILIGFTVYQLQILSRVEFKNAGATEKK